MRQIDSFLNASGVLVVLLVGLLSVFNASASERLLVAVLMLAVFLLFLCSIYFESLNRRWSLTLFWLEALAILAIYFLAPNDIIAILSIVWIVQAESLFSARTAVLLLILSVIAFALAMYADGRLLIDAVISACLFGLFQMFALAVASRATRERELREETAALNRELLATRELLSQSVAQGERVRIARELHDLLGHHMTALILNLEVAGHKARAAAGSDQDKELQEKIPEQIDQALALAKLLLGDIRTAVSELRDEDVIDLQAAVGKLVTGIPETGFEVDLDTGLVINKLEFAETLLRCIQEAVTNVLRHSKASRCAIRLQKQSGRLLLSIHDNGTPPAVIVPGNGLTGMGERVSDQGGSLTWESSAEGFVLRAEFPGEPRL